MLPGPVIISLRLVVWFQVRVVLSLPVSGWLALTGSFFLAELR